MKIKSIYIDGLHNAQNKTYNFDQITYLYGRNGAGKSTILQAIQFVLLGYIPGSKTKAAKLRHARDGKIHVKAVLVDDTGSEVTLERILTENIDMFNTTPENYDIASVISDIELPIFNFNEFVGQTSNKLKDYFIKNILPVQDGILNWKAMLTNAIEKQQIDNKEAIIDGGIALVQDLTGSPLDQAVAANEIFKNEVSAIKKELASIQGAIDSLIFYDDYSGPTDITEIDRKIVEVQRRKDSLVAYQSAEANVNAIQDKISRLVEEENRLDQLYGNCDALFEKISVLETTLADIKHKLDDVDTTIHKYSMEIAQRKVIADSNGVCPYTKNACGDITPKAEQFKLEISEYRTKLEVSQNVQMKLLDNQSDINGQLYPMRQAVQQYQSIKTQISALQSSSMGLPPKPLGDESIGDLNFELQTLNDSKMKAYANQQYNATIDELTRKKFRMELELEVYKAWVKKTDVNDLQTQIMKQPFAELADKMTGYIQTMYGNDSLTAHFNVEAKANSFSFGLIREEKYIPYDLLSSGEKCLYALALMICIIDNSKSPLKVLLLDDSLDNLDDVAIENTFTALKNITDIQFIMAGVKHCESAKDAIIEIGDDD